MAKRITLSVIIIARNDQKHLPACMASVAWADEIIVIDNESEDRTAAVAKKHGARVYSVKGLDFSQLRNVGAKRARGEWLLYIDTDETVTPELKKEIIETIQLFDPKTSPKAFFIKRINYYLGHRWPYQDKMQRLLWKRALIEWHGALHESPKVKGETVTLDEPLIHKTHRTLDEMVEKTNKWSVMEADLRVRAKHPPVTWWRMARVFLTGFFGSFFGQAGYRAGTVGLIESMYQGYSMFITYGKLWEKQERQ